MAGPLAQMVRQKFPGAYDDMDDASLEKAVLAKHPEYADLVQAPQESAPSRFASNLWQNANPLPALGVLPKLATMKGRAEVASGIAENQMRPWDRAGVSAQKGDYVQAALHGLTGLIPLVGPALDDAYQKTLEGDMAGGLGAYAGIAAPQVAGAALAPAVNKLGNVIKAQARPLVRAAIKPTVATMKQQAGASVTGLNAQANRVADSILRNRWSTPEAAEAAVKTAEGTIQSGLEGLNTSAPSYADRYVNALAHKAGGQVFPRSDQAIIRAKAAELPQGPLGETVTQTVMQPPDWAPNANPVPVDVPVRQLRESMPATEALDTARGTGRWTTRKAWGEQKGAELEAEKAAERGVRDSVKVAAKKAGRTDVIDAMKTQREGLVAKSVLDRMKMREGSRDAVSLPAWVVAAPELAAGKVPASAMLANWMRNNQLRLGFGADSAGSALGAFNMTDAARAALIAQLMAATNK